MLQEKLSFTVSKRLKPNATNLEQKMQTGAPGTQREK